VPLDRSYSLECQKHMNVYWKIYTNNGKIEIVKNHVVHLKEFARHRDGFYQCHASDTSEILENVFVFSNGKLIVY